MDTSDFLLPGDLNAFDLATKNAGKVISLVGLEVYPWRLRRGAPAPFRDHIARRRNEKRRLLSWCAAPASLPDNCIWHPGRPIGVLATETQVPFKRAMGVIFPGVPVKEIVRKSTLVEDAELLAFASAEGSTPIRLPAPVAISKRPKNGTVTVVSAMKNEGPFVLDWVAHNLAIGVDRILVYSNDCADGTDKLLDLLADADVVHRDNPYRTANKVPQHAAFRAAETEDVVTKADWLLTLDVDEYINIHTGEGHLSDLLNAVPDAHLISMPWRLFGNADIHGFEDVPVTEQFTQAAPPFMPRPYQAWAFKTLYRNAGLFRRMGVHRPKGVLPGISDALSWLTGSGQPLPVETWRSAWRVGTANWGYDLVTLNHYAVRSAESFLVKRDRGRVNHVHEAQDEAYWFRMNHNVEEDLTIQRLAPKVAKIKAGLLSLPGVAQTHAEAVAWHKKRIKALKEQPDMGAFYAQITSERMEKLSRLGPHFGMQVFIEGPDIVPDEVLKYTPGDQFYFNPKPTT
jgi:hypothetical protein